MTLEYDFAELFPHTITLESYAGVDGYSKPRYGSPTSYTARVEYKARLVKDSRGNEVVSSATVYLMIVPPGLSDKDRITLPDGKKPVIITVEIQADTSANYFAIIYT